MGERDPDPIPSSPPDDSTFRSLDPSGGARSTGVRRDPRQDQRLFGRAATGTAPGGDDVLDYLDDAERIMEGGKFWADDEAFAQSLLVATMTGNNGELERLIARRHASSLAARLLGAE